MTESLSPVHRFGDWWAKREDLACAAGPDYPAGSKVRQFAAMVAKAPAGTPMLVGCSADSCMQVYLAAASHRTGVKGIIFTAARKVRSDATEYAIRMGADVREVKPGHLSVVRARARAAAKAIGTVVRWDTTLALADTAQQVADLPDVKRIIVATGSGLTAAGVLTGLARIGRRISVLAVAVSPMATAQVIDSMARIGSGMDLSPLSIVRAPSAYDDPAVARLPDGTPLDPFYAAKALRFIVPGDLLWIPGVRPVSAMPDVCRRAFA